MAQDQRARHRAVQQTQGYTRVSGVHQTALAFDENDIGVLRRLEDELLCGTRDEVGDDGVHRRAPSFDEDPGLPGGDEARLVTPANQRVPDLEHGGHLADVAIRSDGVHDVGIHLARPAVGDRQVRRRFAGIEDAHAELAREGPELRVVRDEGVQSAPNLDLPFDREPEPGAPLIRQPAAGRRDPHDQRRGAAARGQARGEIPHDGDRAAESEHVLRRLPRFLAIEHGDDPLGEVADTRVRRLRGHRAELSVGDDEESMLVGGGHGVAGSGVRRARLGRNTAGWKSGPSPYTSPCSRWRTSTSPRASSGTATIRPIGPSSVPMARTPGIARAGGMAPVRAMIQGTKTWLPRKWPSTPMASTASTCSRWRTSTSNSAGSTVETMVPKNGTRAARPANSPNASQNGTSSAHSPSAVRAAKITRARIGPFPQARRVAAMSARISAMVIFAAL